MILSETNVQEYNDVIMFLTNNTNALGLFTWLGERSNVFLFEERLTLEHVIKIKPYLIISYNYSYIISSEIIEYMHENIINLHISYLPWNRGASPNIWSFVDDTPKGVTIHKMSPGLDEGDIIYQEEMTFDINKETFATSYAKLHEKIVELFKKHWDDIKRGNYHTYKQEGEGTKHTSRDLNELTKKIEVDWNMKISDFLTMYRKAIR